MLYETPILRGDVHMVVDWMKQYLKVICISLFMLVFANVTASIAQTSQGKHQVIVDPGHGGADSGVKISEKYYEKDITLAIASMLKNELDKSPNMRVLLTRSSDKDVSLSERIKIIKASNSNVLIGIHVNAGYGKESSGYEIYFPGYASVTAGQINSREILQDMAKNRYLNDSVKLAQLIQRNMETIFPRKSRGVRNAPFVTIEGLTMTAVIVEIGFATNQEDRKKIADENVRSAIAHALSKSIIEYF